MQSIHNTVIKLIGDVIKAIFKHIFIWTIKMCRTVIGVLVMKTGFDLASGSGAFIYREADTFTGVFVIIIGAYFILSSLFPNMFGQSDSSR